jgi:hypothetical protein
MQAVPDQYRYGIRNALALTLTLTLVSWYHVTGTDNNTGAVKRTATLQVLVPVPLFDSMKASFLLLIKMNHESGTVDENNLTLVQQ